MRILVYKFLTWLNSDLGKGKAGTFKSSLAAGATYTYEVVFSEPFSNGNYVLSLALNTSNYTYYISEQTLKGFKVHVYANAETSGASFQWSAVQWPHFQ